MVQTADVVVVGGGVIGLAIAWRVANQGGDVVVVDPAPARAASWVAAGMLAPVTEAHYGEEALLALALASHARYRRFVEELEASSGRDCGYRTHGTAAVARDRDDLAVLAELCAYQQRLGLDAQRLSRRELRALEPALSPGVAGGVLVEADHQIDPRKLVTALLEACEQAGVRVWRRRVSAIEVVAERVVGAELDGDRVACAQLVVAAGCWSGRLQGLPPEARPPVRPVKGQLLVLRDRAGDMPLERAVRGLEVYLVPRDDGRLVVGATVEEQGFDTTVTAGAVSGLLHAAAELVPALVEFELSEAIAGLRPGSPDNAPLLGSGALDGLVIATGHHRNGILLAPVTADAIAALLATGATPPEIAAFSPLRFARPEAHACT